MISFGLEVFLEGKLQNMDERRVGWTDAEKSGYPLLGGVFGVQHRDGSQLEPTNLASAIYDPERNVLRKLTGG